MGGIVGGLVFTADVAGNIVLSILIGRANARSKREEAEIARIGIGILVLTILVGCAAYVIADDSWDRTPTLIARVWGFGTFILLLIAAALHFLIKRAK